MAAARVVVPTALMRPRAKFVRAVAASALRQLVLCNSASLVHSEAARHGSDAFKAQAWCDAADGFLYIWEIGLAPVPHFST